ncbi:MAG TPA: IMP dehydrogenase, partial [Chitinophagaceae bacterium]|nr:IMP dehydrogenase [Chitinophagaceae bacterium]
MATIKPSLSKNKVNRVFIDGLTFDDVLLLPAYSQVLPREVNLHSHLTKEIVLNIPLLSA